MRCPFRKNHVKFAAPRIQTLALLIIFSAGVASCSNNNVPPPTPEASADDATVNDARYKCLLDQGVPVTRDRTGSIQYQGTQESSTEAWQTANESCDAKLAQEGLITLTDTKDLRREYDLMRVAHTCLVQKGFPVSDWPSQDVYVDGNGEFNLLAALAPIDPAEAQEACQDEFKALNSL